MTYRLALLLVLAACPKSGDKPKPVEPPRPRDAQDRLLPAEDARPLTLAPAPPLPGVPAGLPTPPANPRVTPEALALGELLFFDPRLSAAGTRACATCHDPATNFAGTVQVAADGKENLRRTPTLANLAWKSALGWDGRYPSFAPHLPAHLKGQLGEPLDAVTARISAVPVYAAHLARIGGEPQAALVQALEAYVMTRYDGDSPWDRAERTALTKAGTTPTDPVIAGYQLFIGKAHCGVCHPPPLYTDQGYHRVAPNPYQDPGRQGAFATPTLRGAAIRPAFFHAGTATTLGAAVAQHASPPAGADPAVATIPLSPDETKQLVTFLKALTADRPAARKPDLP